MSGRRPPEVRAGRSDGARRTRRPSNALRSEQSARRHRACRLVDLRGTVRRAVFFVADRPVRVGFWATLVLLRVVFAAFRLAAFLVDTDVAFVARRVVGFLIDAREDATFFVDTDVPFVARRVVGFLADAREDATFFVDTDLAGGVRLTDEVAFFGPAFLFAVAAREVLARCLVDAFPPEARPPAFTRARLVCRAVTDRVRLRPTMLRTPGPGIRLVCSPVFQRTVSIAPFTDVTTPARGPDLDVTSTRSPTTAIRSSSRKLSASMARTSGGNEPPGNPRVAAGRRRAVLRRSTLI
jgi:hypothetical protein